MSQLPLFPSAESRRQPVPVADQARHHEAGEQQDGALPQGGEPAQPPQGQDEPCAGQVPRKHQEAAKLTVEEGR